MKHAILIAALCMPLSAMGQNEETPQLPDWVIFLAQLGDFYQQWCEDQGAEYKRDPNHQLWNGGQWKCYLNVPEPSQRG